MILFRSMGVSGMIRRYTPVPAVTAAVLLLIVVGTSCITALRYESLALSGPQAVTSPVKAHMLDGSTIIYRDGAVIENDRVTGNGARYDIRLQRVDSVSAVALDSVLAMESFDTEADLARSIGYGLVALVVAPVAAMAFVIVVVLYAFAAIFSGVGVASHTVVPDPLGRSIAFEQPLHVLRAADRDGRDVTDVLSGMDGLSYTSTRSRVRNALASRMGEVEDHVELEIEVPEQTARIGLHLRMRNSLLPTVRFYDTMLKDRGERASDSLAGSERDIGPAVEVARWAAHNLGMRVSILEGAEWREVAYITDPGPLSWHDVGVVVPVNSGAEQSSARIRLAFPADHWRIDGVAPFESVRFAEGRAMPLSGDHAPDGTAHAETPADLVQTDESSPGHGFEAVLRPDPDRGDRQSELERTFFLASQGYYVEWVLQNGLAGERETEPFPPGAETLVKALRDWRTSHEAIQDPYYATRHLVR